MRCRRAVRISGMDPIQFNLSQDRIPQAWYNILADLPEAHGADPAPWNDEAIGPDDLARCFP